MEARSKNTKDDNFMLYVPKKKHTAWELRNSLVYLVFKHDKTAEKFLRWLVKKPTVSDLELDEIGSIVWQAIDGNRNVYEIGQKLLEEKGEGCQPVYDRLIMYLRYLNRKGWITFEKGNQS